MGQVKILGVCETGVGKMGLSRQNGTIHRQNWSRRNGSR